MAVAPARAGSSHHPRWVRAALMAAALAVTAYVASWLVAGLVHPGYAPGEQAISELFALGAPALPRALVIAGLAVSGVAFLALAPALDRALPGRGRLGPVLVALAGLGTLAIIAAPCTAGCPGVGTTPTDTWHVVWAGVGYGGLTTAPLAVAWRVRHADPSLATWSWLLGGIGSALLAAYVGGLFPIPSGLQQRTFNTIADAWYVLAPLRLLARGVGSGGPGSAPRISGPTRERVDSPGLDLHGRGVGRRYRSGRGG